MFTQKSTERGTTFCLSVVALRAMDSAFDRLLRAATELKSGLIANKSDLAKFLNESPQSITNWHNRGIPKAKLLSVARAVGISAEWLETGVGPMVPMQATSSAATPVAIPSGAAIRTYEAVEELDPNSYVLVDRFDVHLSAGCGNFFTHRVYTSC